MPYAICPFLSSSKKPLPFFEILLFCHDNIIYCSLQSTIYNLIYDILSLSCENHGFFKELYATFTATKCRTRAAASQTRTDGRYGSEVWDQIYECLKRCMMNVNNDNEQTSDIKRIELQLKNSTVRDGTCRLRL